MNLVSVILPTYNRRETIQAAIASVQRQTFGDWELIVVDDGSTDGTASLIEGSDPRLVLIRQENQGVNGARNTAMLRARGRYIAFLDSDDEWLPHHLELSVAFFRAFPDEDFLSGEFCEDGSPEGTAPFLHTALTHWYPPLAERAGSSLLKLPRGESDPYLKVFPSGQPIGAWGRDILARTPYRDARLYQGRVFEHMRFGFLFALQPTVITRRAREAAGLFDHRYRIGADYGYLARLCRSFRANFVSLPMAIKHEYAGDGTRLSEGHLSTGPTRFEFERDLLRQFEDLFRGHTGEAAEIAALRRARQAVVGLAALGQGNRREALRYLGEARQKLRWLVRFAPTPAVALRIYVALRRARSLAGQVLREPSSWDAIVSRLRTRLLTHFRPGSSIHR
ncbi:MAG TPA: glycosyltransferase family 2 protein [Burkholderiales bacterium]|nr:glycosyltransferase family 2 protein [Burkholderiales bacterium]